VKILKTLIFFLFIIMLAVPLQPVIAQDRDPQAICGETYIVQRGDTLVGIAKDAKRAWRTCWQLTHKSPIRA
jgi:hypothetical protein